MDKLKKILKYLSSSFLTLVLTTILIVEVLVLNLRIVVSENSIAKGLDSTNIIENVLNEDILSKLEIDKSDIKEVLENEYIKDTASKYISDVIRSAFGSEEFNINEEELKEFLNKTIDEYNKVSDNDISDSLRKEIMDSIDSDAIREFEDSINNANLNKEVNDTLKVIDYILYGNFTSVLLVIIIALVLLIALVNYSVYKWMPYVSVSTSISGVTMLFLGLTFSLVSIDSLGVLSIIKENLAENFLVTAIILIIISIALVLGHIYINKQINDKKEEQNI